MKLLILLLLFSSSLFAKEPAQFPQKLNNTKWQCIDPNWNRYQDSFLSFSYPFLILNGKQSSPLKNFDGTYSFLYTILDFEINNNILFLLLKDSDGETSLRTYRYNNDDKLYQYYNDTYREKIRAKLYIKIVKDPYPIHEPYEE